MHYIFRSIRQFPYKILILLVKYKPVRVFKMLVSYLGVSPSSECLFYIESNSEIEQLASDKPGQNGTERSVKVGQPLIRTSL